MKTQQPTIDGAEAQQEPTQAALTPMMTERSESNRNIAFATRDSGHVPCVLVVDDEAYIVEFLCLLLEEEGYRVLRASDGRQAWELALQARPDLVISDIMMPGMTGLQLLDRLRGSTDLAATPVILMSAVSRTPGSEGVLFVPKPFDIDQMLDLVSVELMIAD